MKNHWLQNKEKEFPPWNTEQYGFDFGDGLPEGTKEIPKIYGYKTPEREKFVFRDGHYEEVTFPLTSPLTGIDHWVPIESLKEGHDKMFNLESFRKRYPNAQVPKVLQKKGETVSPPGSMGLGKFGVSNITFRRKWRWTLEGQFCEIKVPEMFIKLKARPTCNDNGVLEDRRITTDHVEYPEELVEVLTSFCAWNHPDDQLTREGIERWNSKLGTITLRLYDGAGTELETWIFEDVCVKAMNFGDLDYSCSSEPTIEATWEFKKCTYETPAFCSHISGATTKKQSKCLTDTPLSLCSERETNITTRTI